MKLPSFVHKKILVVISLILSVLLIGWLAFTVLVPRNDSGIAFDITERDTLISVLSRLDQQGVIRNARITRILVTFFGDANVIAQGQYASSQPMSDFDIARMIARKETTATYVRVTIPEGLTVLEIASILHARIPNFNTPEFIARALPYEGYLFPDTYFFLPSTKADTVIKTMRSTFDAKVKPYEAEITRSGRTLEQIVIMASLLEEEARTTESRKMISGILWKRLDIDMPLQVDAVFPYIIGKNTYEVTLSDLAFDSPYNTYKYRGLPRGPITNPSIDSIVSALRPTASEYIYYLSDLAGRMYYAVTFEKHIENRQYLNKR